MRRSAILGLTLLAVGCKQHPEADPAKATALATKMIKDVPVPGYTDCTGEQVIGGATMTYPTAMKIAGKQVGPEHEMADWINPVELDSPAARTLADAAAGDTAKRRATAELLAAPFYLVYVVDHVNAPIALGIKELKLGSASGRALRYTKNGTLQCVRVFVWANDEAKNQWAMDASDKALIDPAVAQAMKDDLRAQMLKRVAALGAPPPRGKITPKPLKP